MNQTAAILNHLQVIGPITPLEALDRYQCFRLAARIADIKALGYTVETETVVRDGKRYARYRLQTTPVQLAAFG